MEVWFLGDGNTGKIGNIVFTFVTAIHGRTTDVFINCIGGADMGGSWPDRGSSTIFEANVFFVVWDSARICTSIFTFTTVVTAGVHWTINSINEITVGNAVVLTDVLSRAFVAREGVWSGIDWENHFIDAEGFLAGSNSCVGILCDNIILPWQNMIGTTDVNLFTGESNIFGIDEASDIGIEIIWNIDLGLSFFGAAVFCGERKLICIGWLVSCIFALMTSATGATRDVVLTPFGPWITRSAGGII